MDKSPQGNLKHAETHIGAEMRMKSSTDHDPSGGQPRIVEKTRKLPIS